MKLNLTSETVQSAFEQATELTSKLAQQLLDNPISLDCVTQDPIYQVSRLLARCQLVQPVVEAGFQRILDPDNTLAVLARDGSKWQEMLRLVLVDILAIGFYVGFVASVQSKATLSVEDLEKFFER